MTYQEPGREPERWETERTQYIPPAGQPAPARPYAAHPPQRQGAPMPNPFGNASNEAFGIAAVVLALLGLVLGIVTLTSLDWYSDGVTFSKVHDLESAGLTSGFATVYFSWFAWAALIVAVLAAVGASFPSPAVRALRVIGVVVGVAAAGLSFLALKVNDAQSYTEFLKHARAGFYLMVIAYVLAAIGAGIGPRKV